MKYEPRSNFDETLDTDWRESAKGNYWRKRNGLMLIVGGTDEKGYWARVDENFLKKKFESREEAQKVTEESV